MQAHIIDGAVFEAQASGSPHLRLEVWRVCLVVQPFLAVLERVVNLVEAVLDEACALGLHLQPEILDRLFVFVANDVQHLAHDGFKFCRSLLAVDPLESDATVPLDEFVVSVLQRLTDPLVGGLALLEVDDLRGDVAVRVADDSANGCAWRPRLMPCALPLVLFDGNQPRLGAADVLFDAVLFPYVAPRGHASESKR